MKFYDTREGTQLDEEGYIEYNPDLNAFWVYGAKWAKLEILTDEKEILVFPQSKILQFKNRNIDHLCITIKEAKEIMLSFKTGENIDVFILI